LNIAQERQMKPSVIYDNPMIDEMDDDGNKSNEDAVLTSLGASWLFLRVYRNIENRSKLL
jgi:hypothetical protein